MKFLTSRAQDEIRLRDKIAALGGSLFARGLSPGSSGNISVRPSGCGRCAGILVGLASLASVEF